MMTSAAFQKLFEKSYEKLRKTCVNLSVHREDVGWYRARRAGPSAAADTTVVLQVAGYDVTEECEELAGVFDVAARATDQSRR